MGSSILAGVVNIKNKGQSVLIARGCCFTVKQIISFQYLLQTHFPIPDSINCHYREVKIAKFTMYPILEQVKMFVGRNNCHQAIKLLFLSYKFMSDRSGNAQIVVQEFQYLQTGLCKLWFMLFIIAIIIFEVLRVWEKPLVICPPLPSGIQVYC